ncbi:MAG TPA: hydantoinase/oxoprolinase family protein [Acidobacteriota bacterium]|nr:hydantoinase/oxoprolinase family protein [Acidobacteriota bacterium]
MTHFTDYDYNRHITIGLGVDAGGTYTDAVIFDLENNRMLSKAKSLTTRWDFTVGISKALDRLDRDLLRNVQLVALSTTLATNAIVENEGQKVGLILMPPFGLDIAHNISCRVKRVIQGQLDITGREIAPVRPDEIKAVAGRMIEHHGVTAFAVSGFAGSINPLHELQVKKIVQEETGFFVSCGHELSEDLNFQTRAVTALLNARIIPRLAALLLDLEKALKRYGIDAPVVVVKGDGTLISSEMAKRQPVETILSGPAASVAGARHLTGLEDALVVDMGGTTTDTAVLSSGMVGLNEEGSNVGGHRTHVKALDIRTIGMGGDSLISYERTQFHIGPKRVAPIAWLGRNRPGTKTAMEFVRLRLKHYRTSTRKMQILTVTGNAGSMRLSSPEEEIMSLLEQRPYSLDELLHVTGAFSEGSLHVQRLEANFLVQRCGLTFTDLLHIDGRFVEWDTEAALEYAGFYSFLSHKPMTEMISHLFDLGAKRLSLELLKRRLHDDADADHHADACPVCKTMIRRLLYEQHPDYEVAIRFRRPVIGIGAPIRFFLPQAVMPFTAKAIVPDNADVANAIGAITSHVVINKQAWIIPGDEGGFIVGGISGAHGFKTIEDADRFAREELTEIVRKKALEAGTNCRRIIFETKDSRPLAATGEAVFLKRTISARLKGRPDRVVKMPAL